MASDTEVTDKQLKNFLGKVDEISGLIAGLKSDNENVYQEANQKADEFFARYEQEQRQKNVGDDQLATKYDRSIINKADSYIDQAHLNPDEFMLSIEADAKRRAESRALKDKKSTVIKEKGNELFKQENYEEAAKLYTEALDIYRLNTVLWTNRAQTYIKLGRYQEAIKDCEWAMKVEEDCEKAYVHTGRAYLGLKEFDKAIAWYEKGLERFPKMEKTFKTYVEEAKLAKDVANEEEKARELFLEGNQSATNISDIIKKLENPKQPVMFYCGGLRLASGLMRDTDAKTVFRLQGGITLLNTHPLMSKVLKLSIKSLSQQEVDLLASVLETMAAVGRSNEENQRLILAFENMPETVLRLMNPKGKREKFLSLCIMQFVVTLSVTKAGQEFLLERCDFVSMLTKTLRMTKFGEHLTGEAVITLKGLSKSPKFNRQWLNHFDAAMPVVEGVLLDDQRDPVAIEVCVDLLAQFSLQEAARNSMAKRKPCWSACEHLLKVLMSRLQSGAANTRVSNTLQSHLALLVNISTVKMPGSHLHTFADGLAKLCIDQILHKTDELGRAMNLLGNVVQDVKGIAELSLQEFRPKLLECLTARSDKSTVENATLLKSAIKIVYVIVKNDTTSRELIGQQKKALKAMVQLLEAENEIVIGNSALCLTELVTVEGAAGLLTKTDIIKLLLVHARDGKKVDMQYNCAILLAKLSQRDDRHLERLRELHGMGILHDVLKQKNP